MSDIPSPGSQSISPPPASRKEAPRRIPMVAEVISKEQLTPHMIRIVFGGEGLRNFRAGQYTDHYVKLQIPPPGARYTAPFDPQKIRDSEPAEMIFRTRTYSVRDWNQESGELTIDFVHHGDTGVAGPWASAAEPGDLIQMLGPGGDYAPKPDYDWHLLVGDEACIPAIAASLARIPDGKPVIALVEVEDESEQVELDSTGRLDLSWIHRNGRPRADGDLLLEAVKSLDVPEGRCQAFVHGEAGMVRSVRKYLLVEQSMPKEDLSATGYWKHTATEEGWRLYKGEWKRLAELDESAVV